MMSQSLRQIEELMRDILNDEDSSSSSNLNENKHKRGNSRRDSILSDFSEEDLQDEITENTMRSLFSKASLNLDCLLERKDSGESSVTSETNSDYSSFSSETEQAKLYVELLDAEKEESRTHKEMVMVNLQKISMDLEVTRTSRTEVESKIDDLRNKLAQQRALRDRIFAKVIYPNDVVIVQPMTEPTNEENTIKQKKVTEDELIVKLGELRYQLAERRALRDRIFAKVIDPNVVIVQSRTEPTKDENTIEGNKTPMVVKEKKATEDERQPRHPLLLTSTERQSYSWFSSFRAKRRKIEREPLKRYAELPSANRDADRLMAKIKMIVKRKNRQNKGKNYGRSTSIMNARRCLFFPRNRLIPV